MYCNGSLPIAIPQCPLAALSLSSRRSGPYASVGARYLEETLLSVFVPQLTLPRFRVVCSFFGQGFPWILPQCLTFPGIRRGRVFEQTLGFFCFSGLFTASFFPISTPRGRERKRTEAGVSPAFSANNIR